MLATKQLIELFNLGVSHGIRHSSWRAPSPTPQSIARINRELAVELPQSFIDFSRQSEFYGFYFGSLGEDYDSDSHILSLNHDFHGSASGYAPLPAHLILINHGHDGDCDCFDRRSRDKVGEYPIAYWDGVAGLNFAEVEQAGTFPEFLEKTVIYLARSVDQKLATKIIEGG